MARPWAPTTPSPARLRFRSGSLRRRSPDGLVPSDATRHSPLLLRLVRTLFLRLRALLLLGLRRNLGRVLIVCIRLVSDNRGFSVIAAIVIVVLHLRQRRNEIPFRAGAENHAIQLRRIAGIIQNQKVEL